MKTLNLPAQFIGVSIALLATTAVDAGPAKRRIAQPDRTFVSLPAPVLHEASPLEADIRHPDLARNAEAAIRLMEALDVSQGLP